MKLFARLLSLALLTMALGACKTASYGSGPASTMPPPPPPGAQLPRWDYYCANRDRFDFNELLQAAGQNGWELVTTEEFYYCFKRPHVEAPAPPAAPATPP